MLRSGPAPLLLLIQKNRFLVPRGFHRKAAPMKIPAPVSARTGRWLACTFRRYMLPYITGIGEDHHAHAKLLLIKFEISQWIFFIGKDCDEIRAITVGLGIRTGVCE